MERIWVDRRAESLCQALALHSRAALLQLMEGPEARGQKVRVVRRTLSPPEGPSVIVFCKHYTYQKPSWRFWGRASKARREFHNYGFFEAIGICCARRVICLEDRDALGRLRDAFILTEAVQDTVTLENHARQQASQAGSVRRLATRLHLARQLAEMTRTLHAAGGAHNDLYWRNVLVQNPQSQTPTLWWIDCPRGRRVSVPFLRRRKQIKDLAALEMESTGLCSRTERIRFLNLYLGTEKLDARGRALQRAVHRFRQRRWPVNG